MKKSFRILLLPVAVFFGTLVLYCPLVISGVIKASGRDQHIVSPVWAQAIFYPAAKVVRFIDLLRFRSQFLGTWISNDPAYPYKLTFSSLAFDTASGTLGVGDATFPVTLRDGRHELYRDPFGNPIMRIDGRDDWYLRFNRRNLTLIIPSGPSLNNKRPMHSISFCKGSQSS